MDALTETLARMWIECDPNREHGTGDTAVTLYENGESRAAKHWEWFIPRAEASLKFLDAAGYEIKPKT